MSRKPKTIGELPVGSRLLCRSRIDWRTAVISRITEEKAVLTVCSPTGRTYRLSKLKGSELVFFGNLPVVKNDFEEDWRENFAVYDIRW